MVNQEQTSLSWLDEEINFSVFSDRRHASRFKSLMQKLWREMGNSLPFSCQDNAAPKAAYRFLSSNRIDEQHLLQGHSEATGQRIHALQDENILFLQDTTTFGYHRDNPEQPGGHGDDGRSGSRRAGLLRLPESALGENPLNEQAGAPEQRGETGCRRGGHLPQRREHHTATGCGPDGAERRIVLFYVWAALHPRLLCFALTRLLHAINSKCSGIRNSYLAYSLIQDKVNMVRQANNRLAAVDDIFVKCCVHTDSRLLIDLFIGGLS